MRGLSGRNGVAGQATRTLWRPVGRNELRLIKAASSRAFPPRLPEQPIFYPVPISSTQSRSPATGTRRTRGRRTSATSLSSTFARMLSITMTRSKSAVAGTASCGYTQRSWRLSTPRSSGDSGSREVPARQAGRVSSPDPGVTGREIVEVTRRSRSILDATFPLDTDTLIL